MNNAVTERFSKLFNAQASLTWHIHFRIFKSKGLISVKLCLLLNLSSTRNNLSHLNHLKCTLSSFFPICRRRKHQLSLRDGKMNWWVLFTWPCETDNVFYAFELRFLQNLYSQAQSVSINHWFYFDVVHSKVDFIELDWKSLVSYAFTWNAPLCMFGGPSVTIVLHVCHI